jgi:hypothetical protein
MLALMTLRQGLAVMLEIKSLCVILVLEMAQQLTQTTHQLVFLWQQALLLLVLVQLVLT